MINKILKIDNFLTKTECNLLLKRYKETLELKPATIKNEKLSDKRKSSVAFIDSIDEIDQKLKKTLKESFNIKGQTATGLNPYQFTEYRVGEYYEWHTDSDHDEYKHRFCSIVIQLNDDYTGGILEIKENENKIIQMNKGVGNLCIFYSNIFHRVTSVESGVRYSLVNWVSLESINNYKKTLI